MAEFTVDDLKLAFSWHTAREIVISDHEIADREEAWLSQQFSTQALTEAGFLDASGDPTARYDDAVTEAARVLPDALDQGTKLAMITMIFKATLADDEFRIEEGHVLIKAAHVLGLSTDALDAHLGQLDEVGEVELPEPDPS